jgi:hypothetical protein
MVTTDGRIEVDSVPPLARQLMEVLENRWPSTAHADSHWARIQIWSIGYSRITHRADVSHDRPVNLAHLVTGCAS